MARPLAAITGASSGIGEVFARKLVATHDLLLIARRRQRLETIAAELRDQSNAGVQILVADLTEARDLLAVAEQLSHEQRLSLLVNNAGAGARGVFWDADVQLEERMLRLNVLAVLRLSHAALRNMVPRNSGAVINVASVAGFVRRPGSVGYGATKAWVIAFTEALHLELHRTRSSVRVQALCPGFTYSQFHDAMKVDRARIAPPSMWLDAGFVVEQSLRALSAGKLFVVPGWRYRAIVNLTSILPPRARVLFEAALARR